MSIFLYFGGTPLGELPLVTLQYFLQFLDKNDHTNMGLIRLQISCNRE